MKANLPPVPPPPPPEPQPQAPSQHSSSSPPARKRRLRLVVAASVAILLLAAGGIYYWQSQREEPLPEPPLPPGITDVEVLAVVEKGHARVVRDTRNADAWGEYATILLANLFDREADQCFVVAAKLDPKDPRWPYARGQIALKRDPPNAVAYLTTAAEAARERPEYRMAFNLALAEALLERGETDRAAEIFQAELAASPQEDRALYGLGLVALARNDDDTARKMFEAAREHPSCKKQANAQLSLLARRRNEISAAKQYEAEANEVESEPPWPDPYLDRVVNLQVGYRGLQRKVGVLERDGRFQEAAEAYLAQARYKRTAQALTGAAVNFARIRDYDQAITLLREAVQLDPQDSNSHYTLALVLFTKAEKVWVPDPKSADAAKMFREVVEEAKRTTQLKEDHANAYLFWGLSLYNLGEPKAAIEPLRKGLIVSPEKFELHLFLGKALAATGDRSGAESSFNTAQQLRPNDPRSAEELAKLPGK